MVVLYIKPETLVGGFDNDGVSSGAPSLERFMGNWGMPLRLLLAVGVRVVIPLMRWMNIIKE
jgi:hypothetical protein